MVIRIVILTLLTLSFLAVKGQVFIEDDTLMGGGLIKNCDEDIVKYLAPAGAIDIQTSIDVSKRLPPWDLSEKYLRKDWAILTQGRQGSCTSFAVAFAITIQRNIDISLLKANSTLTQFSPSFIFNIAKSKYSEPYRSNCKEGISFIDAFLVVRDRGIPSIELLPYNIREIGCRDLDIEKRVYSEAGKTKIIIFQRPFRTVDNFKRILLSSPYYPICIGVYLNNEYDNALRLNKGQWKKPGVGSGLRMHALLIVGFDDSKNAFKVMDWQGADTGDKGFLWMDYSLIENQSIVFDAYICSHHMEYLDPKIGARSGTEMDENIDKPNSVKNLNVNSEFVNDRISFWIKAGYYTNKDIFKISCNYVSDEKNRATFRIANENTQEIISDDIIIDEGKDYCFDYQGISYKLRLVEIAHRGKNILRKAAVLRFTRNDSCNN